MAACARCGVTKAAFLSDLCNRCMDARLAEEPLKARAAAEEKARSEAELARRAEAVVLTTAPTLDGVRTVRTVDVITAECVFGMNIFKDIFAAFSDVFGGRNESTQGVLRDARRACLLELRKEAASLGANAVIAVDLDYSELSGGGKSMLFLVASGTAVVVEPLEGGA